MENENNLRAQKGGFQKPWKLEELKAGLESFFSKNKRYPTASEVDTYPYLPSARSIERSFGGLVKLRNELGLDTQNDLRTGLYSSEKARKINKRAHIVEQNVYNYLINLFGKEFVHREYFFLDDKRTRADFFVYDTNEGFCIDVFYPSDKRNLTGCLNSKIDKYQNPYMNQYITIFLQMNREINQDTLNVLIKNKKKKLPNGHILMSWETFQEFCSKRKPLKKS
ncbi:MAG: hypothetical protein WC577_00655 [Candidatus Paceibacterota bacterium]